MNLFHRRYLALFCALFAATCLGGCFFHGAVKWILGVSLCVLGCLLLLLMFPLRHHRAKLLTISLCFLFIALALMQSFFAIDRIRDKLSPLYDSNVNATIHILGENYTTDFSASYTVSFSTGEQTFRAILECEYPADFSVGDKIAGTVTVRSAETYFDLPNYYISRGIYVCLVSSTFDLKIVDQDQYTLSTHFQQINQKVSALFKKNLNTETAAFSSALMLGNKDLLEDSAIRDFRRTGLSHILAISGMHLSMIMVALEALLRACRMKKETRCILVFLIALFYLALTGFALSTVRAFVMMSLVYLAFLLRTNNDTVTSLFFALFLILLFSPISVRDVGLWLSFLAVLGLWVANQFTSQIIDQLYKNSFPKWGVKAITVPLSSIIITVFATFFVCLPMWLFFSEISLISVLSNLLIAPLVSVFMMLSPLTLLQIPLLSPMLNTVQQTLCHGILKLVSEMSHWENITVSMEYPFAGFIIIPTFAAISLSLILPLRKKLLALIIPIVATLAFGSCLIMYNHQNNTIVTADLLSFGESEMLLLSTPGETVICDMSTGANRYLYETIEFSKQRYATEISALVLTHYHNYHISTFSKNANRFIIRTLYLPKPCNDDEFYRMTSLIATAENVGVQVTLYDREQPFSPTEQLTLELSESTYLSRSTHPTFVLSVAANGEQLAYIAESAHESPQLAAYAEKHIGDAEQVVFGTHGPITKTDFSYPSLSGQHTVVIFDDNILSHFVSEFEQPHLDNDTLFTAILGK